MEFWDVAIGTAFQWKDIEFIKISEHAAKNIRMNERCYFGHIIEVEPKESDWKVVRNYAVDHDGQTPLRMWSNLRDGDGQFMGAIHLVHPKSGNSLCGGLKNSGVGFPDNSGQTVEQVISCKKCLRLARQ